MNPTLHYQSGYKYKTSRDYVIQTEIKPPAFIYTDFIRLDTDGTMWIKAGYAWDGASGPTFDTLDSIIGSLIHDALYQLIREGHLASDEYRRPADRELWRLCIEDGMLKFRADYWYAGVRLGGSNAANEQDEILTAP